MGSRAGRSWRSRDCYAVSPGGWEASIFPDGNGGRTLETRRLILAAVLSLGVLLLWQWLFPPAPPRSAPPVSERATAVPAEGAADGSAPLVETAGEPEPAVPDAELAGDPVSGELEERFVLENERARLEISNRGGTIRSFRIRGGGAPGGREIEMVQPRPGGDPWPLTLVDGELRPLPLDRALFAVEVEDDPVGRSLLLRYRGELGRAFKRLRLRQDGRLDVEVRSEASGFGLLWGPGLRDRSAEELASRFDRRLASFLTGNGLESIEPTVERRIELPAASEWIALEDSYFLTAFVALEGGAGGLVEPVRLEPLPNEEGFRSHPVLEGKKVARSEKSWPRDLRVYWFAAGDRLELTTYWGAKDHDRLAALPYGLEQTVRWGMFGFLVRPLLAGLQFLHDRLIPNWGWAIVVLTVLLKLVLLPLSVASFRSMRRMQKLAPKMQEIRDRYRPKLRDKQGRFNAEAQRQMNEEVMALYRSEGVNPAGGCLPILVQIPIFLAFYNMLSSAVELKWAPWILWVKDLSEHDPWYVLPIVMGATQFVQQKMTPPPPDPFQRRMLQMMPVIFTLFSFGFPSGLVLYWLTNNVVSIGQQVLYNRMAEKSERETERVQEGPKGKVKAARGNPR